MQSSPKYDSELTNASIEILCKLRNIEPESLAKILDLEQSRKVEMVNQETQDSDSKCILESKMIKWNITDKREHMNIRSDSVKIGNHNFVFFARRNPSKYEGIKIFTSLNKPKLQMKPSRNVSLCKANTAPTGQNENKTRNFSNYDIMNLENEIDSSMNSNKMLVIYTSMKIQNKSDYHKLEIPLSFHNLKSDEEVCLAHIADFPSKPRVNNAKMLKYLTHSSNMSSTVPLEIMIYLKIDYIQTKIMSVLHSNTLVGHKYKESESNKTHASQLTSALTPK